MDNSFKQHSSETQLKPKLLGTTLQIYYKIKGWFIAWFVLTEQEKIDAGIYLDRYER